MYLFTRRVRLAPGNTRAAMTWATEITEKVNEITGLNVRLYASTFSPEVGALSWSTFVPDLATLEAANDKLLVDDAYVSMVDAGAKFAHGGADDALSQIIHGAPDATRQIEYVTTVQTVCASGSLTKGIELAVEIAQRAEKTMGTPVLVATGTTGELRIGRLVQRLRRRPGTGTRAAGAGRRREVRRVRRQEREGCLRRRSLADAAAHLPSYRVTPHISAYVGGVGRRARPAPSPRRVPTG